MSYYDPTPDSEYLQDAIKEIQSLESKNAELIIQRDIALQDLAEEAKNVDELNAKLKIAINAIRTAKVEVNNSFNMSAVSTLSNALELLKETK